MKKLSRVIIQSIFILFTYCVTAAADPYDESKACIGPRADMIDYYLGVYRPLIYGNEILPISE